VEGIKIDTRKPLKIFFESSIILGATQDQLLEDPQLKIYVDKGLLDKPERYVSSRELIELVLKLRKKRNIEPFVSPKVKEELRSLVSKYDALNEKILKPLRIEEEIRKIPREDRKIFEMIIYRIFMIKLPILVYEIIDKFSSKFVDEDECKTIRDDVFNKIYRPLLHRLKYLSEFFELSGATQKEKERDPCFDEYEGLSLALRDIRRVNYKKLNDLLILSEAIYSFKRMKLEEKVAPDFYFVSNDLIFIPIVTPTHRVRFDKIPKNIEKFYGIKIRDAKHMLKTLK
jgi:hypothetical protein